MSIADCSVAKSSASGLLPLFALHRRPNPMVMCCTTMQRVGRIQGLWCKSNLPGLWIVALIPDTHTPIAVLSRARKGSPGAAFMA